MTPTTLMLGLFAVVGIAAAGVLMPSRRSWKAAPEHGRSFWMAWILGFGTVGFAGPASFGLGWSPMAWFALWVVVGTLQPSMVVDLLEVRRFRRRRVRRRRPVIASSPMVRPMVTPVSRAAAVTGPPPIRWRAPAPAGRPFAGTASGL